MRAGATVLKGSSYQDCENACETEKKCRSFSYRVMDNTCIWSTASLTFDPDFMFAAEVEACRENMKSGLCEAQEKKYRVFAGMSYRTQGWTIIGGVSKSQCEAMCSKTNDCKAYSARAKDKLCLLGPKGITYSLDFNYYE